MRIARTAVLIVVALVALLMFGNAAGWLLVPASAAAAIKMPLLSGPALSSQMDIGAFFLGVTAFTCLGVLRRRPEWFLAAATLLLAAAAYRTSATLLHGAPFLADMVAVEVIGGAVLVVASRMLTRPIGQDR